MPSHICGANRHGSNPCLRSDTTIMDNNNSTSIQNLEREMSELSTLSVPVTSNMHIPYDYRLRLNSEDLGHHRPVSCLRRANTMDGNIDIGSMGFGCSRGSIDNSMRLNAQEINDETKFRDMCAGEAMQLGYIVGEELELVKAKSHRSVIQNTPDRITCSFKDRYGQSDPSSKKSYLQLGVRVPSKEHVSEIVGKQGSKIKQIREKTGALITTPGEQEDHVFIIEAPPRTALHVAQILKNRAEDITMSRSQESRRRSSCPSSSINRHSNKSPATGGLIQTNSKIVLASGRIQVPKIIVGRIIGTQGSIITTIQRDTGTEIRSPPKEIGKPKHTMADFEILVYQTTNFTDANEARQRIVNAKQLIAHVALYQLEKIRAEEAPYSNYQVQASASLSKTNDNGVDDYDGSETAKLANGDGSLNESPNKEQLLSEQMRPCDWMWADIDKLEDRVAREVVDSILEESKKKTKTRSEPLIYDTRASNLMILGESDSFPNGSTDFTRPRHSLPETNSSSIHGIDGELFYRSNGQSNHPFMLNNNLYFHETESNFCNSTDIPSFINRQESESKMYPYDRDMMFTVQSNDFPDYQDRRTGINLSNNDHVSLKSGDQFRIDPNIGAKMMTSSFYYPFAPVGHSWQYRPSNVNLPNGVVLETSTKTYADSVRLPCDGPPIVNASSSHGTIGDHLKRPSNYRAH